MDNIREVFNRCHETFCKFEDIKNPLCSRPDLNAFLLLNSLVPGKSDIVSAVEHDTIFLGISLDELAASGITEEQVLELCRSGVMYNDEYDSLFMFV